MKASLPLWQAPQDLPLSISSIFALSVPALYGKVLVWQSAHLYISKVEIVAEVGIASFSLEENVARFVAFMALVALTGYRKGIVAVVAAAARFTLSPCWPWLP